MTVHYYAEQLPRFTRSVITIGTFDGVHHGHQKIIDALLREASAVSGESLIITFHPHPRKIVNPHSSLQLINTLSEKIFLLEKKGIDHLVVVPFTEAFSRLPAEAYIKDFLVHHFSPHTVIIGYDHHFGKDRGGNISLLQQQQKTWNYQLLEIPKHVLNEISVSSTGIRNALLNGDVSVARRLLGYSFFFEGKVVGGDKIGRTLGFPTANLVYTDSDKIHLGEGVYAVFVIINGEKKRGMLSVGKRPTLNDTEERVEVNIFDFSEDIYGSVIQVEVEAFLRKQEKYTSLEALTAQLVLDKEAALSVLN
jgi:riboflavin kinase/FMN adenylyltransferase